MLHNYHAFNIIIVILSIILTQGLYGQSVTKKIKRKNRYVILVDFGKDAGFTKQSKVCFYSGTGKKVACGKVFYASSNRSRIRVSKKKWGRIEIGSEARIEESSLPPSKADEPVDIRYNIKAFYSLTVVPIANFVKVAYAPPPANDKKVVSLWKESEKSGMQLQGGGLEIETGVGSLISLAFGLRYKLYSPFLLDTDYEEGNIDQYVGININAASLGTSIDLYLVNTSLADNFYFKLNSGIDYERTDIEMLADRLSDAEGDEEFTVIKAKANIGILSFRLGTHFAYLLDTFGISAGLNLLAPSSVVSENFEGSSEDPNISRLEDNQAIDDLQNSLAIDKADVGVEILFSSFVLF